MIDAEVEIFNEVATRVREAVPDVYLVGEYVKTPPSFPCVSLVEIDNAVFQPAQTNAGRETHAAVTYELNIYSNRTKGKKSECRRIAGLVDEILTALNFTRTMLEPVPNMDDATIYRMLGRYRAVISKDNVIHRR